MERTDNREVSVIEAGQTAEEQRTVSTHRVGTITCGLVLVAFGIMFLLHQIFPMLSYEFIYNMWPVVLIVLGVEILASTIRKNEEQMRFVYDFPAVLLIMTMLLFAMLMGMFAVVFKSTAG